MVVNNCEQWTDLLKDWVLSIWFTMESELQVHFTVGGLLVLIRFCQKVYCLLQR